MYLNDIITMLDKESRISYNSHIIKSEVHE
jgi:hypothetical protein